MSFSIEFKGCICIDLSGLDDAVYEEFVKDFDNKIKGLNLTYTHDVPLWFIDNQFIYPEGELLSKLGDHYVIYLQEILEFLGKYEDIYIDDAYINYNYSEVYLGGGTIIVDTDNNIITHHLNKKKHSCWVAKTEYFKF